VKTFRIVHPFSFSLSWGVLSYGPAYLDFFFAALSLWSNNFGRTLFGRKDYDIYNRSTNLNLFARSSWPSSKQFPEVFVNGL